jgi:GntR family transcriptional regulator of gluconate operon
MNAWRIEAVQSEALWERVVSALRRAILLGELTTDTHLKEPLLAQRFGVSRLPIREAIAQLDREGLVRLEPRRGAFVIGVSDQDISDIYECRMLLELGAIRRAAARADAQALGELEGYAASMDEAVSSSQPQALATADMAFHRRLVTLSGNRALVNAWAPVAPLIETILGISDATCASTDLPEAVEGHRRIIRALAQHDAAAAEDILKVHLAGGESLVYEAIRAVRVQ